MALLKDLTVYGATNLISDTFANHVYGNGFHHNSHNNNDSVLLAGGSYKGWSESNTASALVARNSSGHIYVNDINTQADNLNSTSFTKVYVSDGDWIKYVTKDKFVEAIKNTDTIFDTISINKTLTVTEAWMDTGITTGTASGTINKGDGTYAIQISHGDVNGDTNNYASIYSGIMTIYGNTTGNETEEIILHRGGKSSSKRLYLKTIQTGSGTIKLQIAASTTWTSSAQITFKFRKLI